MVVIHVLLEQLELKRAQVNVLRHLYFCALFVHTAAE